MAVSSWGCSQVWATWSTPRAVHNVAICSGCFSARPKGSVSCCFLSLSRAQLIRSGASKIISLWINSKSVNWLRTLITSAKSLVSYEIPSYSWGSSREVCYYMYARGKKSQGDSSNSTYPPWDEPKLLEKALLLWAFKSPGFSNRNVVNTMHADMDILGIAITNLSTA